MSEVVMIQRGAASGHPLPGDGGYLKHFDFEANGGTGAILLTEDLDEAMRFPSAVDAFQFRATVPKCRPLRADLQPNRPLTAANWEIKGVDSIRSGA